jgi:hypothetical protein
LRKQAHQCGNGTHGLSRYKTFFDFGDAEEYQAHVEEFRRAYQDIDSPDIATATQENAEHV